MVCGVLAQNPSNTSFACISCSYGNRGKNITYKTHIYVYKRRGEHNRHMFVSNARNASDWGENWRKKEEAKRTATNYVRGALL